MSSDCRISGSEEAEKGLWETREMILSNILGGINHEEGWLADEAAAAAVEGLDQDSECTLLCATDFPCDLSVSNSLAPLSKMGIMIFFAVSRRLAKVCRCLAPFTLGPCRLQTQSPEVQG